MIKKQTIVSQHVGVLCNQNGTKKPAAVVNCLFIPVLSVVIFFFVLYYLLTHFLCVSVGKLNKQYNIRTHILPVYAVVWLSDILFV